MKYLCLCIFSSFCSAFLWCCLVCYTGLFKLLSHDETFKCKPLWNESHWPILYSCGFVYNASKRGTIKLLSPPVKPVLSRRPFLFFWRQRVEIIRSILLVIGADTSWTGHLDMWRRTSIEKVLECSNVSFMFWMFICFAPTQVFVICCGWVLAHAKYCIVV